MCYVTSDTCITKEDKFNVQSRVVRMLQGDSADEKARSS